MKKIGLTFWHTLYFANT